MADTSVSELASKTTPVDADLLYLTDTDGGDFSRKTSKAEFLAAVQAEVDLNTSANAGVVTVHSDVSDAGSGIIISDVERDTLGTALQSVLGDPAPILGGPLNLNDHPFIGVATAGEDISVGQFLVHSATPGQVLLSNATTAALSTGFIVMALETRTTGQSLQVAWLGEVAGTALTAGKAYYLSTTSGAITDVPPTGTGNIVRLVGYATDVTLLTLFPSTTFIEAS